MPNRIRSIARGASLFMLYAFWLSAPPLAFGLLENEEVALVILNRFFDQQRLAYGESDENTTLNLKQTYTIEFIKKDGTSSSSVSELYLKSPNRKIVVYSSAEEQSNAILVLGRNQWLYRKRLRRPIRVSRSHAIADNIDLSDILGIYYVEEYTINSAVIDGDLITIAMEALDAQYRYRHVDIVASLSTQDISRIIYRSVSKKEVRRAEISYTRLGDRRLPKYSISPSAVSLERETTLLEFSGVHTEDLPASFFAPNAAALSQLLDFVEQ